MHMFWHTPNLTQPSQRNPGSAMSAELSVGNATNTAAKRRQPWGGPTVLCEGGYRYFKVDVKTKERPRKKSLFPERATVVATTAQGGSKKKCFSNALGYTLVVLEVFEAHRHFFLSIGPTKSGDNTFGPMEPNTKSGYGVDPLIPHHCEAIHLFLS